MSTNLVVNGITYAFPNLSDQGWGDNVTNWATAVTQGMLQKSGGSFVLTADVDFGANFGLKSAYFSSRTANSASAGQVRLANADLIKFRNAANSADLGFGPGSADAIPAWGGIDLVNLSTAQTLTNKTLTAPVISNPSFTGTSTFVDLTTSGNTVIGDAAADTLTVNATVQGLKIASGSVSAPAYANSTGKTGFYFSGESILFSINQGSVGSISSAGAFTLGAASGTQNHVANGDLFTVTSPSASTSFRVDNTNASGVGAVQIRGAAASTGDEVLQFTTISGQTWSVGKDTSDSNSFKLSSGTTLGTNDYLKVSTSGVLTVGASGGSGVHLVNGNWRVTNASGQNSYVLVDGLGASDKSGVEFLNAGDPKWFIHNDPSDNSLNVVGGANTYLNIITTGSVILNNAAIATNATDGFLYIASCAGTPTGTPTTKTGRVPMVYDTTNDKFYIYRSGWKSVTLS